MDTDPIPATSADSGPGRRMRSLVTRLAHRPYGPLITAIILGWLSVPFAAQSIVDSSGYEGPAPETVAPVTFGEGLSMALLAVTAAAVVGGVLGGRLVRTRPVLGLATALFVAWPVAIATLPLLPALIGWHFEGPFECASNVCKPQILGDEPLSGLSAYAESLLTGIIGAAEVAGILALIAMWLARGDHRVLASAFVVAAFASLNFWSIFYTTGHGSPLAAIALIVGSIVWVAPYLAEPPPT